MIKHFQKENREYFLVGNGSISCLMELCCGQLELLHLGAPVQESDAPAFSIISNPGWGCSVVNSGKCFDTLPLAWSGAGTGDYRELPLEIALEGERLAPEFSYSSFEIIKGIAPMTLPQAKGSCETLKLCFNGCGGKLELELYFSLFDTAITRRAVLKNLSREPFEILKFMSALADLKGDFELTTLDGGWNCEAHAHSVPVSYSKVVNESLTGFSSNRHNPGFLLSHGNEFYGFNLVYSGCHYSAVQKSQQNLTRVVQGINPESFRRVLAPYESFETPEAVVAYSNRGLNGLRANMHRFVNEHIVPAAWQYRERPVLYNSWEGCMFSFTESRLLQLAKKAKKAGCELFVLDDGWFGERNSDTAGLGDYNVNLKKLPNGLKGLADKIRALGMNFGLWFEPEAVNPDSALYRAHPDWAIKGLQSRNELLLDLRKSEVRDYIVENVSRIIDDAGVSYVKWDVNRHSTLTGAAAHEYILGLYDVLERIFAPRPQVLLESCASGGNRFDLGMLCFGPQIWASDNTDPIERLDIQEGLSCLYPQSAVGSHVSASAHIQTLRETPMSTRANVSFFGCFGIELELSSLLPTDEAELKDAVKFYKEHRFDFQFGTFSVQDSEEGARVWQVSTKDGAIAGVFHGLVHAAPGYEWLKVELENTEKSYFVDSRPQNLRVGRFSSMTKHIIPVELNPNGAIIRTADRLYRMPDGAQHVKCSGQALAAGIPMNLKFTGTGYDANMRNQGDFGSNIYVIKESRK